MEAGARIDETGLLSREGAAFCLRRDAGGVYLLDLHRTPVDEVEKRVRLTGVYTDDGRVDVDGLVLA